MCLPIHVICCQQFVEPLIYTTTTTMKHDAGKRVIKLFAPVLFDYGLTSANFIVFFTSLAAKNIQCPSDKSIQVYQEFLCSFGNDISLCNIARSDTWMQASHILTYKHFYLYILLGIINSVFISSKQWIECHCFNKQFNPFICF